MSRNVFLLQRKKEKLGKALGKTTGWIHRSTLAKRGVKMLSACDYHKIDDQGLHLSIDGKSQIFGCRHHCNLRRTRADAATSSISSTEKE